MLSWCSTFGEKCLPQCRGQRTKIKKIIREKKEVNFFKKFKKALNGQTHILYGKLWINYIIPIWKPIQILIDSVQAHFNLYQKIVERGLD